MKPKLMLSGGTMAKYPSGGGHWSVRLQYMLGLQSLNHKFFWLELFPSRNNDRLDNALINLFFSRFRNYGLDKCCVLAKCRSDCIDPTFDELNIYNMDKSRLRQIINETDILWNFHCSMNKSLLRLFSNKILLDLDPGHLQLSALHHDMNIEEHNKFFTVGTNIHNDNCEIPLLNQTWTVFLPPIFIKFWKNDISPPNNAPYTSVTQWTWGEEEEMWLGNRWYSTGKRDAYLRFLNVPQKVKEKLELAVNMGYTKVEMQDRKMLLSNGWHLISPHIVARSPKRYKDYIINSRGEFGCAKPIYSELKTGWFSDRSAAYLASGRPAIIEDTNIGIDIPIGSGILTFNNEDEAAEKVRLCSDNYKKHSLAARDIANEYFNSDKVLPQLIEKSI